MKPYRPKERKYRGKWYKLYKIYSDNGDATLDAVIQREAGNLAHTVKIGEYYCVYVKRK